MPHTEGYLGPEQPTCRACGLHLVLDRRDEVCKVCLASAMDLLKVPHGHAIVFRGGDVSFGPVAYRAETRDGYGKLDRPALLVLGDPLEGEPLEVTPEEAGRLGYALMVWGAEHRG